MARKRMIDPEFWSDEKVGKLDYPIQLLFIGMWNFADDEGLIKYSPEFLRSCVFPFKDISIEQIKTWQAELEKMELVYPYGKVGQRYAWIINFRNHQVINRPQPSKLPPPSIQNSAYCYALAIRDKWVCHLCKKITSPSGNANDNNCRMVSIDHLIPVSKGGSDYPTNLKIACLCCNKSRGNKEIALYPDHSLNTQGVSNDEVKLIEVKLSKDNKETQPYWAAFSKETQDKMLLVSKKFNIYQLLGRIKKTKKAEIPGEVVARICTGYLKNPERPRATWPWFIVAINKEWGSWSAEKNIKEGEDYKKQGVAPAIKELLAMILKSKEKI